MGATVAFQEALAAANLRWYAGLVKPTFSPAPWVAALLSVALGGALAWSLYRVLRRPDYLPDRPAAIRVFALGLGLDALWSWLFFAGRHPTVALAAAGALTVVAASSAWHCAVVDRRAGLLAASWVLGTGFCFVLDLSIALRNG